jgi:high-affinity Fe2+/Pb2+ permease
LVGWLIFTGLFGIGDTDVFDLGGIIGAIIGSILVLLVVGWFMRRTGRLSRPAR